MPRIAATVDVLRVADESVAHWLRNYDSFLLPESQWPETVPKATFPFESVDDYYDVVR